MFLVIILTHLSLDMVVIDVHVKSIALEITSSKMFLQVDESENIGLTSLDIGRCMCAAYRKRWSNRTENCIFTFIRHSVDMSRDEDL